MRTFELLLWTASTACVVRRLVRAGPHRQSDLPGVGGGDCRPARYVRRRALSHDPDTGHRVTAAAVQGLVMPRSATARRRGTRIAIRRDAGGAATALDGHAVCSALHEEHRRPTGQMGPETGDVLGPVPHAPAAALEWYRHQAGAPDHQRLRRRFLDRDLYAGPDGLLDSRPSPYADVTVARRNTLAAGPAAR
jgi:hypothetical protein